MKNLYDVLQNVTEVFEIYRPKSAGISILSVAHAGVGFLLADGTIFVLHRTPNNDTHLSTYEEFIAGQSPTIKSFGSKGLEMILERASSIYGHGKKYSIFTNCEHLKNFVLFGKAESEQLKIGLIGLGAGALISSTLLRNQPWWIKLAVTATATAVALNYEKQKKLSY